MRLANRLLLSVALLGTPAAALAQNIEFHDIRLIDRAEIEVRDGPESPDIVRLPEEWFDPQSAPPSPDPTLARPLTLLSLDASELRNTPVQRATRLPDSAYPIQFSMAGYWIDMLVVEARTDPDFNAIHFTALAIDSDDYARFSISRSGPEIAGTVIIDDVRYRILPDDFNPAQQLVYPVAVRGTGWKREHPADLDSPAGRLEARHLQMAWVAENQPERFSTRADGRPEEYRGGRNHSLGVLDFWNAIESDALGNSTVDVALLQQETEQFLNEVQHFTWVHDRIAVQIEPQFESDLIQISSNGFDIKFLQLIHGIPVTRSLSLSMGPTGEVIAYSGLLMREDMAETSYGARITQEEARAASEAALLREHGIASSGEFVAENLIYNVVADDQLDLIWEMALKADCGMTIEIDVDGVTGEARSINGRELGDSRLDNFQRFSRSFADDPFFQCRFGAR